MRRAGVYIVASMIRRVWILVAAAAIPALADASGAPATFCPEVYRKGLLQAPFNVAFLHIQKFNVDDDGKADGLLMSSFFNAVKTADGRKVERFSQRDLVARIADLGSVNFETFDGARDIEVLTDLDGVSRQVWPNESARVPDGVLPFEAVISPQGFQSTPRPGRPIIRLSSTVNGGTRWKCWCTMPTPSPRASAELAMRTGSPSIAISPLSGA